MENDKEKQAECSENNDKESERGVVRIINDYRRKKEIEAAENDIIFSEPLTKAPKEPPQPLVKGSIDKWFFLFSLMLIFFGVVMSYSASSVVAETEYDNSLHFLIKYIEYAAIAIIITIPFVILARPWFWRLAGLGIYVLAVFLLLLVMVIGRTGGGAQRWISIGSITIQPSEIAKLAIVLVLALYMSKYEKEINSTHKFGGSFKHGFLIPMMLIGFLCGLIILQPHLSGTIIVGLIGLTIMFLGGTKLKWLLTLLGVGAVGFALFLLFFGYSVERVQIWIDIESMDPLGAAWQTLQSLNAIGSGGFFGVGLGGSRQKFGYVPEPQNDFIFAIICEELGFIGALLVVSLFSLLVWRGIKIGQSAPDKFSALVVFGITFKIALQVILNIAVVTNSMPNTGISLPFFSSGGTANMVQIFELGIILSISRFSARKQ